MPQNTSSMNTDTLSIEGGLFTAEWLGKVASQQAPVQSDADYAVRAGFNVREEIGLAWRSAQTLWRQFDQARNLPGHDAWGVTQQWSTELLRQCFTFQLTQHAAPVVVDERNYPVPYSGLNGRVPVVVSPHDETKALDTAHDRLGDNSGERLRRRSCFGLLQESLNAIPDALWGVAINGLQLRIARDNASLTRPAWVEVDLERLFTEDRYADFSVLWLLLHASRFGAHGAASVDCALEQWRNACREQGTRARETLRVGVEQALLTLGQGFVSHPANSALREHLATGRLSPQDYLRELLRLVYRQIFLLTVEERQILHRTDADANAVALYSDGYSLRRLRERSVRRSAHDRHSDLWQAMKQVWQGLSVGEPLMALPPLGGLFETTQCPTLDACRLENRHLLLALFNLAWLRESANAPLTRVNWRDMGPEELGSIYESLLELVPQLSNEHRQFGFLTGTATVGNARKTSGSYYTADPLVQDQLDSSLEPIIAAKLAAHPVGEESVQALLSISMIDPACGSGHFLLAAARRIAGHLARVRAQMRDVQFGHGGQPTPDDYRHALRDVVTHCVYGVDLNPMALELARMALWLEAYTPDVPLGFLDHHFQHGNALLGVLDFKVLLDGIPDGAYKDLSGDDKNLCKDLKKLNKQEREGLLRMRAAASFSQSLLSMDLQATAAPLLQLDALPDGNLVDIEAKRTAYRSIQNNIGSEGLTLALNLYCAAFLLPKVGGISDTDVPTTLDVLKALMGQEIAQTKKSAAVELAQRMPLLHWQLAFAQVFSKGGFTCVLGNPPWDIVQDKEADKRDEDHERQKNWFNQGVYSVLSGRRDLYKLFLCLSSQILSPNGYLGLVLPIGFLFEDDSVDLRKQLFDDMTVTRILHAQNRQKSFFPAVDSRYRFLNFVACKSRGGTHTFTPVVGSPVDVPATKAIEVNSDQLDDVLGPSRSAILFNTFDHATLHARVRRTLATKPLLSYGVIAEFHASTDKELMSTRRGSPDDWALLKNGSFHYFDPRFGPVEKYVNAREVALRLQRKKLDPTIWLNLPRLVFRDIARNDDTRTLIATLVPPGFVSTYDAPMVVPDDANDHSVAALGFYAGFLSSFVADFLIRPFVDKHIKGYTLAHVPIPMFDPSNQAMSCVSEIALDLYGRSIAPNDEPESAAYAEYKRNKRSEIDANIAILAGITIDDLVAVLDSFSSVKASEIRAHGRFLLSDEVGVVFGAIRNPA